MLIYSEPQTTKLRNIAANPRVTFNFNSTEDGGDVAIISGTAAIDPGALLSDAIPTWRSTVRDCQFGHDPERFAAACSIAIRVTPLKLRGF